jgi:hypothetical protein
MVNIVAISPTPAIIHPHVVGRYDCPSRAKLVFIGAIDILFPIPNFTPRKIRRPPRVIMNAGTLRKATQ